MHLAKKSEKASDWNKKYMDGRFPQTNAAETKSKP